MDEAWKQLPRAAVIVCASVLASPSARAQEPEAETDTESDAGVAPTEEDQLPIAPTCGMGCHGNEVRMPPDVAPPPVEPASKPGCAVEDADDSSPLALAALSLGLIAGAASRRRRERDESKA